MAVHDWGQGDVPYLVTELLGGGSLRGLLDVGHRLDPAQARQVGLEAARALEYAHRRGLVHRDIKPANLLFDDEGRLRVADFGLARALAEAAWTEPSGAVLGTARYASPEQAQGRLARRSQRRLLARPGDHRGGQRRGAVRGRHHPRHADGPCRPPGPGARRARRPRPPPSPPPACPIPPTAPTPRAFATMLMAAGDLGPVAHAARSPARSPSTAPTSTPASPRRSTSPSARSAPTSSPRS